eukprot:TRINITY_DN1729_c0_g1_i4.p4 TRINITY_DN1729_c0_g1~~TRINITY_DN1729_c0_g1_i4.p4  ORF type:complete len:108 (+),score=9.96 TRINITY_DN1729_c0_g1_i4:452-775(+)
MEDGGSGCERHRSMMWLRQMAQVSTTMSHAQRQTEFHFLTSKRFFGPAAEPAVGSSTSSILFFFFFFFFVLFLSCRGGASATHGVRFICRTCGTPTLGCPAGTHAGT